MASSDEPGRMDHVPGAHNAGYPVVVAYSARMAYGDIAWWDEREGGKTGNRCDKRGGRFKPALRERSRTQTGVEREDPVVYRLY